MESYLEKLLSQIRCKKARPYIAEEIRGHIESQIEDNLSGGMVYEEAEKNAVADMGDPIAVGISLDKIHRPRVAWKLLIIVGVLSLLGILLQQSILYQTGYYELEPYKQEIYQLTMAGFISSVIIGFIIMCVIYFIDYTMIAKYSKLVGLCIIAMGVLCLLGVFGANINGARYRVGFGMFSFSPTAFMMFYVPIYGGILYKYRDGGLCALLKAVIWLILPVVITFKIPSLVVAGIMMVSMLIQLTVAILKGWFKIPVKKAIVCLWAIFMILPAGLLFIMYTFHLLEVYQVVRIRSFLSASGDEFYITSMLRTFSKDVLLIGNSGNDVIGSLSQFNSDYIFSYILNSYGLIAGAVVVAALATFVMFLFGASIKQKNELGLTMGVGCGMVLLLNIIINLLVTVGAIPTVSSFLPFLSIGRDNIILCYALVGIIMSIYRYKEVYPKHVKLSLIQLQKNITINM